MKKINIAELLFNLKSWLKWINIVLGRLDLINQIFGKLAIMYNLDNKNIDLLLKDLNEKLGENKAATDGNDEPIPPIIILPPPPIKG